jgi:hypothetical protein
VECLAKGHSIVAAVILAAVYLTEALLLKQCLHRVRLIITVL